MEANRKTFSIIFLSKLNEGVVDGVDGRALVFYRHDDLCFRDLFNLIIWHAWKMYVHWKDLGWASALTMPGNTYRWKQDNRAVGQ